MASLKVIKLVTGEELIGIVEDGRDLPETNDGFTVENLLFITGPLKITSQYNQETRAHSLYVSDWVPSIIDDCLPIDKRQILTLGKPTPELETHYYELILASHLTQKETEDERNKKSMSKKLKNHKFDDDDMQ